CAAGFGAIKLSVYRAAGTVWYEQFRWKEVLLLGVLCFLVFKFKKHPIIYIALAGAVGFFLKL
ncbi:MAG: chromate transporter, partial [Spirochaetaceae bacterium]|nr:chromate transporter [Spirochaetaceae bacterium]